MFESEEDMHIRFNELEFRFYDRASLGLSEAIDDLISVQSELVTSREQISSEDGFLISRFDHDEVSDLFMKRSARLVLCRRGSICLGYSLLTSIDEFTDLYSQNNENEFSPYRALDLNKMDYFYQIGVRQSAAKTGIGSQLMVRTKEFSGKDLLADILVSPVKNSVSAKFFIKHNFAPSGLLTLSHYRNFGSLHSEVFVWSR